MLFFQNALKKITNSSKIIYAHGVKAVSHRIRLQLTIRLMANGSLPTCSKNTTDNTSLLKTILRKPEAGQN